MSYATASDFTARYATRLDAAEIASHYLPFAAQRLDGWLAPHFTVPFSANNRTARDLTLELAYLLVLQRSKEPADRAPLAAAVEARLGRLARGEEAMLTDSGEALFASTAAVGVWSDPVAAPVFGSGSHHWPYGGDTP